MIPEKVLSGHFFGRKYSPAEYKRNNRTQQEVTRFKLICPFRPPPTCLELFHTNTLKLIFQALNIAQKSLFIQNKPIKRGCSSK